MIDRRSLMISASAFVVSGCVTCKLPGPRKIQWPVSDAHGHFFNASDLPVAKFIEYVFLPANAPNLPQVGLALVDIAGWLAKKLALSATAELGRIRAGQLFGPDEVDSTKFASELADLQERRIGENGYTFLADGDPETDLGASHLYLALMLGAINDSSALLEEQQAPINIREEVYQRIAENGSIAETQGETLVFSANAQFAELAAVDSSQIKAAIAWVFLMCQSRCHHVEKYKRVIASGPYAVRDVANLLVDYDAWLGEGPDRKSTQKRQVQFWTAFSDETIDTEGALRLHTFAGFDPLREVEERLLNPGGTTTLDRMLRWAQAGQNSLSTDSHRVAGFKLYPPMGFRPDSNADLDSIPNERAGQEINRRWDGQWDNSQIGARLDTALEKFFRNCARSDIPILAHARESNGSMPYAKWKASPHYWLARARAVAEYGDGYSPLRVCLGHFDMRGNDAGVLEQALEMNRDGLAKIYFDISYDDRVLASNAAGLLDDLARVCSGNGGERYIMFATDWIMLGQQAQAPNYLGRLIAAASQHGFWGDHVDKLFRTNFLDFMGPASPN